MRLFRRRPPAARLRLDHAIWSEPGSYAANEDAAGQASARGLTMLAVADGLGGHQGGERASRLVIDRAVDLFQRRPSLEGPDLAETFLDAHRALRAAGAASEGNGLRTTLVLLVSDGITARWAHVGDSRLYVFHDGTIEARTRDHSVPEMLFRAGEIGEDAIRHHPDRSRLLQALGQETDPRIAVSEARTLKGGEAFLLCSDGWWETVSDQEMERLLQGAGTPQRWLKGMAAAIVAAARTPQDNYTAVAAFLSEGHA